MEYIVSSPIGQLSVIIAEKSRDLLGKESAEKALKEITQFVTTEANIPYERIEREFNRILKNLINDKCYQKVIASFLSIYFKEIGNKELMRFFAEIVTSIKSNIDGLDKFDRGFISGLFANCLMNDKMLNKGELNIEIPKNVEDAIMYIESEGFKVHIDEKK